MQSQRGGLVVILWPGSTKPPMPNPTEHLAGKRVGDVSPIRMCSFHLCFPDTYVFNVIRSALILIVGENERLRMKFHSGTYHMQPLLVRPMQTNDDNDDNLMRVFVAALTLSDAA